MLETYVTKGFVRGYPYRVRKDIRSMHGRGRSMTLSLSNMRSHDLIPSIKSWTISTVKIWSQIKIGGSADQSAQLKGLETWNRWAYSGESIKFEIRYVYIYDLERVSCVIHIFLLKWFNVKTYVNASISHIRVKRVTKIHMYTYGHGRTDRRFWWG